MSEKIGVGIITCKRPEFFKKCFLTIPSCVDELVVVDDGIFDKIFDDKTHNEWGVSPDWIQSNCNRLTDGKPKPEITVYYNESNFGVAKSKNKAIKHLLDKGCDHIFLIEDDMLIKDPNIFQAYINASKKSGIQHLMFGYHGPANKNGISKGKPCPRLVVDYGDFSLAFNQHCVGAFCYYSRKCLEDVGLIDEKFRNAFDHVSHSYDLALKGYSTPYWWWTDLANSLDYIEEQACSEENSSIKTPESMQKWQDNIRGSVEYFKEKFGVYPFGSDGVRDTDEKEVLTFLKSVRK